MIEKGRVCEGVLCCVQERETKSVYFKLVSHNVIIVGHKMSQ